ncbi:hypothetical protein AeRB84_017184 [Aphanomyces euteiches]|nr:hypothetical protein AeRB84_017184 [Aphanomyces euteiches]
MASNRFGSVVLSHGSESTSCVTNLLVQCRFRWNSMWNENVIGRWMKNFDFGFEILGESSMGDAWDIAADLPFLIVKDEELSEELAHVSAVLASFNDESTIAPQTQATDDITRGQSQCPLASKPTTDAPPQRRKKFSTNYQAEICHLQTQVEQLKRQLDEKSVADSVEKVSWKHIAWVELQAKRRALDVNDQLKGNIQDNKSFIHEMQTFFHKRPRLTIESDIQSEEWKEYKLAAKASLRVAAIHAIADRQYGRMDTAFINASLAGVSHNVFSLKTLRVATDKVIVQLINHATLAAPYHAVGTAVWQTSTSFLSVKQATRRQRSWTPTPSTTSASRPSTAFLATPTRSPSFHEDELAPHMIKGVDDQWGWITVAQLDNPKHCRLTLLMQIMADASDAAPPQLKVDATVDSITTALEKFSCSLMPQRSLPTTEPLGELNRIEVTGALPPSLLACLERGRRMERLMRRAVDRTILDFNPTKSVNH